MVIEIKLLVSNASNICFKGFDVLSNALSISQLVEISNKFT